MDQPIDLDLGKRLGYFFTKPKHDATRGHDVRSRFLRSREIYPDCIWVCLKIVYP